MMERITHGIQGNFTRFQCPRGVLTYYYLHSTLVHVAEQSPLTRVHPDNPEMNPVSSEWYELITPPTCQGSLVLEDKKKKEWSCSGCNSTFRSGYETRRHIETAGMEVRCRYCERAVNAATFALKRHIESSLCERRWGDRGCTGERTVDGAFRA